MKEKNYFCIRMHSAMIDYGTENIGNVFKSNDVRLWCGWISSKERPLQKRSARVIFWI